MNRNRIWVYVSVLLIVAVMGLGWMLGVAPKLADARTADRERVVVEAQNADYELQLVALEERFNGLDELKAQLAGLRESVPLEADIPALVRQVDELGRRHGVTLTTVSVNDALVYAPVAAAPATDAATATDPSGTATGEAPVADAAAPAGEAGQPAVTAPDAATTGPVLDTTVPGAVIASGRVSAANFIAVPVSLEVEGGYASVLDFVEGLQAGKRLFMVTGFNTAAATAESTAAGGAGYTASITGLVYVLLDSGAQTQGAG